MIDKFFFQNRKNIWKILGITDFITGAILFFQRKQKQASERDFRYQQIMRNLVRRYVTVEQRRTEGEGVTEDDVNEIKQDISAFRCELIEILKNSGMNTSTASGATGEKNFIYNSLFLLPLEIIFYFYQKFTIFSKKKKYCNFTKKKMFFLQEKFNQILNIV